MASISAVRPIGSDREIYNTDATHQVSGASSIGDALRGGQANVRRGGAATPATHSRPDHARISTAGTLIAQALSVSDVRTEKVAALRKSIAAGTYHVPALALAGRLVDALAG